MQPVGPEHAQLDRGGEVGVVGVQQAAKEERAWRVGDLTLQRAVAVSLGRPSPVELFGRRGAIGRSPGHHGAIVDVRYQLYGSCSVVPSCRRRSLVLGVNSHDETRKPTITRHRHGHERPSPQVRRSRQIHSAGQRRDQARSWSSR